MHAGREVLMEVDDNILLTVDGLQGILDQQFRPRSIHLLNILIIITLINYITIFIRLFNNLKN